jgi:hypothetical protein
MTETLTQKFYSKEEPENFLVYHEDLYTIYDSVLKVYGTLQDISEYPEDDMRIDDLMDKFYNEVYNFFNGEQYVKFYQYDWKERSTCLRKIKELRNDKYLLYRDPSGEGGDTYCFIAVDRNYDENNH